MTDMTVTHACVVTMNPRREVYSDGAIAIKGNRIAAVGPTSEVLAQNPPGEVIDGRGMLVIPGLIDGHNHPNHYLSNGIGDDVDIMTWAYRRVYPYEATLSWDETYIGALGAFVEGIRNGTTCFNDPGGLHADAIAQAAIDSGIRGIVNRSTRDLSNPETPIPEALIEDTDTNLQMAESFVSRWNSAGDGRLRAWCSLRYVFNVSDALCLGIKKIADRYQVGIHAHAAAIKGENEAVVAQFGKRSLMRFYELGLFGPNLYLVHVGYPDDQEIDLMRQHDCKVAHCPTASMLGAYGVITNRMIPRLMQAGITVSLGTDSATAGGHLDMVRVMYVAACAHKDAYADATIMGAYKALEMATIDGAKACLWDDEIGSLEPDKRADFVLVDATDLDWHPARSPVANLVYAATGRNVRTVVIDGRIVMRDRVVLTIDIERLKKEIAAASRAWRERARIELPSPWPVH